MAGRLICTRCRTAKPKSQFYRVSTNPTKLRGLCKECRNLDVSNARARRTQRRRECPEPIPESITCRACLQTKPWDCFHEDLTTATSRATKCKQCLGKYRREFRSRPKVKPAAEKICNQCGATKPIAEFNRSIAYRDGYTNRCRVCRLRNERLAKLAEREGLTV